LTNPKDIHPIVMKVLDELSERYLIHKRPTIKKSDNLELGWGGNGHVRRAKARRWMSDVRPTVEQAMSTYKSLRSTARALSEAGIPARRGGEWTATQVRRVLMGY